MRRIGFLLLPLLLAGHAVAAEPDLQTVDGSGALALAALVGGNSPLLSASEKDVLAKYLDGQASAGYPAGQKISVLAAKVTCKASDVDITSHSCELDFGGKTVTLKGRHAHEIYATLAEIGVPPDGAAGSIYEAVSDLKCTIDPNEVKQNSGGGAHCDYAPPN